MPNPMIIPAAIGAVGSLAGGLLGSRTDSTAKQSMRQLKYSTQWQNYWNTKNLRFSKSEQRRAKREFKVNTENAIRKKVRDAKKAGLHPLYALGANAGAGTSSVNFMPGQMPTGSGVQAYNSSAALGRGISQAAETIGQAFMPQSAIETAQVNALNASATRDEAQAALAASQAARTVQLTNSSQDGALMTEKAPGDGRTPLYRKGYDNRDSLGPLAPGEAYILEENIADALEGIGALGLTGYANVTGKRQGRKPNNRRSRRWSRNRRR